MVARYHRQYKWFKFDDNMITTYHIRIALAMLVKKLSITTSQKLHYLNMTVWCRQCSKDVSYVPSDEQCWSTVGVQYGANSVLKTSPTSVQTNNVGVLQGAKINIIHGAWLRILGWVSESKRVDDVCVSLHRRDAKLRSPVSA